MALTDEALWIIDRNLGGELSLGSIAAACGVSRFHMAHAFGQAAGAPVMDYVRARRLSEAAEQLAAGAGNILEVALEAGYGSHEAFSRAFRARFGVTPEGVRRRGATDGLPLAERRFPPARPRPALAEPVRAQVGEVLVVGLADRSGFDVALQLTPTLWRRFMPDFGLIENRLPIPVGVMADADDDGAFTYLAGAEVSRFGAAPAGLVRRRIEPADYAVFTHPGHISAIPKTYAAIFNDWLPAHELTAADAPVMERHQPSFDPATGLGGMKIWVPIAPRS